MNQVATKHAEDQVKARNCLLEIFECCRFLARQGIALRDHYEDSGNMFQLLQLMSRRSSNLRTWLERHVDYTSPLIQNEMLSQLANNILRQICNDIRMTNPPIFSIVVDGTRDINGAEQESICLRYVTQDLKPAEVFLGYYETSCTTGQALLM